MSERIEAEPVAEEVRIKKQLREIGRVAGELEGRDRQALLSLIAYIPVLEERIVSLEESLKEERKQAGLVEAAERKAGKDYGHATAARIKELVDRVHQLEDEQERTKNMFSSRAEAAIQERMEYEEVLRQTSRDLIRFHKDADEFLREQSKRVDAALARRSQVMAGG